MVAGARLTKRPPPIPRCNSNATVDFHCEALSGTRDSCASADQFHAFAQERCVHFSYRIQSMAASTAITHHGQMHSLSLLATSLSMSSISSDSLPDAVPRSLSTIECHEDAQATAVVPPEPAELKITQITSLDSDEAHLVIHP